MHELVKSLNELEARVAKDPKAQTSVEGTVSVTYNHTVTSQFNFTWTFDFPEGTVKVSRNYNKLHSTPRLLTDAISYLQSFFDFQKYVIALGDINDNSQRITLRLTNKEDHKRH